MKNIIKEQPGDFPLELYLKNMYQNYKDINTGEVASYIPELSKADPHAFGISLMTNDGAVQEMGDTLSEFTIQSLSKPFVYGLILDDLGIDSVLEKINVEPSGDTFNSISLEPITGRPLNPMINAGAIVATSCVKAKNMKQRLERIVGMLSCYAGRDLIIDKKVYKSEKRTGHRNRALAHMLRNFDVIERHIEASLDVYFQQCSVLVTAHDLAVMAATLANDGVNPLTGKRAISSENVPMVLSVMAMCGMYDYSGRWLHDIGLPAKSGVSGGIIAILPGQFGLSTYSPRLDARGNSVRGGLVCRQLSQDFGLHLLRVPKIALSVIQASYNLKQFRSKRVYTSPDSLLLDQAGERVNIFELQGEIRFATAEVAVRHVYAAAINNDYIIIDFKKVPNIDLGGCKLLELLIEQISSVNCTLIIASYDKSLFDASISLSKKVETLSYFSDLDHALEWAEHQIIHRLSHQSSVKAVDFFDNEMCRGMSINNREILAKNTNKIYYKKGDCIVKFGDFSDKIFFLTQGDVSVYLHSKKTGYGTRITTLSAGMFFGELALVGQLNRTADVFADTDVECHILMIEELNALCVIEPELKIKLLENLAKNLVKNLLQSNMEVIALSK